MAALSDYQQLANLHQAQLGGYGALGIGGLLGGGITIGTTSTDSTSIYTTGANQYAINIQQAIIPQIQEAVQKAKKHFSSFIDELRSEIREWHGGLRA